VGKPIPGMGRHSQVKRRAAAICGLLEHLRGHRTADHAVGADE
jgi:hypothetical protein